MHLLIYNKFTETPDINMLTVLGASDKRGKEEKIGQFGSGFLYTLALFARKDLLKDLVLFVGDREFRFVVRPVNESVNVVCMIEETKFNDTIVYNLNISTEFGIMDWHETNMGLRELISNAIDSGQEYGMLLTDANVKLTGYVHIYIKATEEVIDYYNNRGKYFLMLRKDYDKDQQVIVNSETRPARFYRKGVFVGEVGEDSLFDYNIDSLALKESRVIDSYEAEKMAAMAIRNSKKEVIKYYLENVTKGCNEKCWEHKLSGFYIGSSGIYGEKRRDIEKEWTEAYSESFGKAIPVYDVIVARAIESKGKQVKYFTSNIVDALSYNGITTSQEILSADERQGRIIIDATQEIHDCLSYCWSKLTIMKLIKEGRERPGLKCFEENTKSGTKIHGFYRDNTIYINNDIAQYGFTVMLVQTMLEELAHYITGAEDFTRDLQEFSFKIAAKAILIRN